MPANSSIFNKIFYHLSFLLMGSSHAVAQLPALGDAELDWLGDRIYQNECGRKPECLTSWNQGESFPSLGIGHFIWFRGDQTEIYTESFPDLLVFYQQSGVELPAWLQGPEAREAPWPDRDAFYREYDGPRLAPLRDFLLQTQAVQVAFIVQRMERALPVILSAVPASERESLAALFYRIAHSDQPRGLYALIDYIHFKGEGISTTERYADQGWGLLQVLQHLSASLQASADETDLLDRFADSAAAVLRNRVANAPTERNESRWLAGWLNRVDTYRPGNL